MRARIRSAALLIAALVAGVAVSSAVGSQATVPGIPSIYVNYNPDCTFSIAVENIAVTSTGPPGPTVPPGAYQVAVYMPNPATGYQCGAPVFELKGPGVDSVTTFPYESIIDSHVLPALQPSSTYVAVDNNAPGATAVYFTTAASGSSSSLLPTGSTTTSPSHGSTDPGVVGSDVPPLRGKLVAAVSAGGAVSLQAGGRAVESLKAGAYNLVVQDADRTAGFSIRRAGGGTLAVTTGPYVGTRSRRITLTAGTWAFFAKTGKARTFVVAKA